MNIKIVFDFHDIFVDSKNAWINSFYELSNNKNIIDDYNKKISKKDICKKYNLDYEKVEELYRIKLVKNENNIEFAQKLSKYYDLDIVSMSRKNRLIKDIQKFSLEGLFKNIYSKEDINDRESFLLKLSEKYDWVVFFNHEYDNIIEKNNLIYIPINFNGNLLQFKDKSFTEHAKNKLLYNELSNYYMQAIANDTNKETDFIEGIYNKYLLNGNKHILDCCCGVGRHDYLLGKKGFSVTGIDISPNQIENAKKIHNNENVNYMVMDVRNIELDYKNYDMSICMWTTYNYLSLNEDFMKFIKSNYNHQNKDAILVLDSKNIPKLEKRRVYKRNSSIDDMSMELIVNKFIINNIQNSQYFYFIKENNKKRFLFDEEFVRFYSLDEIKNLVSDYYDVVYVYGDFDFSDYNEKESNRFIIILKRK